MVQLCAYTICTKYQLYTYICIIQFCGLYIYVEIVYLIVIINFLAPIFNFFQYLHADN